MIRRYLYEYILSDLPDKMVFVGGPRQVGKTTLAKNIGEENFSGKQEYLNWDFREDRRAILESRFQADKGLVIFDEIHKYKNWKNYLKGEYDKHKDNRAILVTGSSRLDIYRKGGDSLLGRYHYYRLHPLSLAEFKTGKKNIRPFSGLVFSKPTHETETQYKRLQQFGGFPEIWLKQDEKELRRWHNERTDRLIREDIRDVESIRDLSNLQVLVELLKDKAGAQLSLNSLTEDLRVTHKTVSQWVDILERFYYLYRIYPYQSTKIRSLRKEPKMYLWDWSEVSDLGRKFENFIASHLLKLCHGLYDAEGYKVELYYLRDKDQREVDFLVCVDKKPWFCVEAKRTDTDISPALKHFREKLKIPFSFQVIDEGNIDFEKDGIRVISAQKFLNGLW